MIKIFVLVAMLMMAFPAFAQANVTTNSTQECLDNSTLQLSSGRVICIEGVCDNVERVWNNACKWGCDSVRDECFADPVTRYWWVAIVVVATLGFLFLIVRWFG